MAAIQVQIADTIAGMKRAMNRIDDASESDSSIHEPTNRGNKLKRKAKYVQWGRLWQADGPKVYRRKIDYNGYSRHIISHNPPRIDAYGDVIDDEEEPSPSDSLAEDDPYSEVRIEELLMPLTSASELSDHPSLSVPYKSRVLEEMVQSARDMVQREQETLWRMKQLLLEFRGDEAWVPCSSFETMNDLSLLAQNDVEVSAAPSVSHGLDAVQVSSANWDTMSNVRLMADLEDAAEVVSKTENGMEVDAQQLPIKKTVDGDEQSDANGRGKVIAVDPSKVLMESHNAHMQDEPMKSLPRTNGDLSKGHMSDGTNTGAVPHEYNHTMPVDDSLDKPTYNVNVNEEVVPCKEPAPDAEILSSVATLAEHNATLRTSQEEQKEEFNGEQAGPVIERNELADAAGDAEDQQVSETDERPAHRMTTRARAHAANSDPATTSTSRPSSPNTTNSIPSVHPFFLVPPDCLPDRNRGLQPQEANETRKHLSAYVQKQEEVCRGAQTLLTGLMRALRLRKTVLRWCRAEAHVGECSDGEDWIDREEWGFEDGEELRKGEEAEEEENAAVSGKKTRRRGAA